VLIEILDNTKIRNLLSCPLEEGLENEEVQLILEALGCGILDKYESRKLRYGKVGIAVDADDKQHCRKMLFA
jgi:DNA gyrase/topoisomerase IV subunit B